MSLQFFKTKKTENQRAFAMLFAVLTASLLVALGISIFGISLKELMIATSEQDSQTAYYAADSAEECALYWDLKVGSFPTCLDSGNPCTVSTSTNNVIQCNGNPLQLAFTHPSSNVYQYSTSTFFGYTNAFGTGWPEAGVTITKTYIASSTGPDNIKTQIDAQGHNTGIIGTRVERGISQAYNSQ